MVLIVTETVDLLGNVPSSQLSTKPIDKLVRSGNQVSQGNVLIVPNQWRFFGVKETFEVATDSCCLVINVVPLKV